MNTRDSYARRVGRKGTGVLPPNPTRWDHEHNGLDLREQLSISLEARLEHADAFELLEDVVGVIPHTELLLTPRLERHFSGLRAKRWSGMCVPCPEGDFLVVYNAEHPETRIRATLMEEFFHLRLGHKPTRIRAFTSGGGDRDFDAGKEGDAYGSGAAALVPYKSLRAMCLTGASVAEVARHFHVSEQLVEFRVRVSKLRRKVD
jgi:IrrE N-terminal-like domain